MLLISGKCPHPSVPFILWTQYIFFNLSTYVQASPWAAAVTDKVQDMQKQMAGVNALTIRANLAEDTLAALKTELNAAHQDLKDLRESEGRLKGQVDTLTRRVQRRNLALKAARKSCLLYTSPSPRDS